MKQIVKPWRRSMILVVDDEPAISSLLRKVLEADGNHVEVAADGEVALLSVEEKNPDMVVLDIDMPRLNGLEVCRRLKHDRKTRMIPILVLTGRSVSPTRLKAWELGADEFLCKPFVAHEVVARCRSLLRQKSLIDELDSATSVVFALARAVEAKSAYTSQHSTRVTQHCLLLARCLGLSDNDQDILRYGAVLHDIGKISTPESILNKNDRLTPEEYDTIKQHPIVGANILEPLQSIKGVIPLVRWHHERCDGKGYPDGLPSGELSVLIRILSVADVYDALASPRPYRSALSKRECIEIMIDSAANGGLDTELVKLFIESQGFDMTDS